MDLKTLSPVASKAMRHSTVLTITRATVTAVTAVTTVINKFTGTPSTVTSTTGLLEAQAQLSQLLEPLMPAKALRQSVALLEGAGYSLQD